MSTFKIKCDKKYTYDTRITIDAKHKNIINEIKSNNNKLPKLKKKLETYYKKLEKINNKKVSELSNIELDEKIKIKKSIKDIETNIEKIENNDDMNDYFLNTAHILYKYYTNQDNETTEEPNINLKKNSVLNYFNQTPKKEEIKKTNKKEKKIKKLSDYTNDDVVFKKATLIKSYMSIVDKNYVSQPKHHDYKKCSNCNKDKLVVHSEGYMVCEKCGEMSKIIIDSDKPSFKDPPPEISYFAYKRINHFNEILAQFQGKESTEIPQVVFDKILIEIKKERITNMATLTNKKVKDYLKRLRLNKYYEHVPHIINRLSGLPPPILNPIVEEKLRIMFKEIQGPFRKVCPPDRKNFLSYYYVLHKFIELLGLDEFKSCFPLLKSREKLHEQDKIWRDICHILKWEFIRSV